MLQKINHTVEFVLWLRYTKNDNSSIISQIRNSILARFCFSIKKAHISNMRKNSDFFYIEKYFF